mmetsp:Transcript_14025/g.20072  ORF Transcript_14025/g.20072 Transcript_14025/m.20072 type:complete len:85 (+) Transcript_14025:141-395(+)
MQLRTKDNATPLTELPPTLTGNETVDTTMTTPTTEAVRRSGQKQKLSTACTTALSSSIADDQAEFTKETGSKEDESSVQTSGHR